MTRNSAMGDGLRLSTSWWTSEHWHGPGPSISTENMAIRPASKIRRWPQRNPATARGKKKMLSGAGQELVIYKSKFNLHPVNQIKVTNSDSTKCFDNFKTVFNVSVGIDGWFSSCQSKSQTNQECANQNGGYSRFQSEITFKENLEKRRNFVCASQSVQPYTE